MVNCPVTAPAAVGSNCTFRVTDWAGFKVTGKVAPDIVNPVPLNAAELMVTGAVPVEVNVNGRVDGVFTVTLPNARLAGTDGQCGRRDAAAGPHTVDWNLRNHPAGGTRSG